MKKIFPPLILIVTFFLTGCSMSDEDQPVSGSLGVGSNSEITFPAPNEDTYNQQYNVAATSNAVRVNSETNAGVTTTRFNLSELGLSQKEITLTFRKE